MATGTSVYEIPTRRETVKGGGYVPFQPIGDEGFLGVDLDYISTIGTLSYRNEKYPEEYGEWPGSVTDILADEQPSDRKCVSETTTGDS